jgi:DNA-binding CsgD family transcriptional regulator
MAGASEGACPQGAELIRAETFMSPTTKHYSRIDAQPLFEELLGTVRKMGFGQWIYSAVPICHPADDPCVNRISSYPDGFIDDHNGADFAAIDPSTPYWIRHESPASYRTVRRSVALSSRQLKLMSLNHEYRVNKGVVIPIANVIGFKAVLALAYDGSDKELDSHLAKMCKELVPASRTFNQQFLLRHKAHFLNHRLPKLTMQKKRVAALLARGHFTKQVADMLGISVNAVDKHIAGIKQAMHSRTLAEAVAMAVQWELI